MSPTRVPTGEFCTSARGLVNCWHGNKAQTPLVSVQPKDDVDRHGPVFGCVRLVGTLVQGVDQAEAAMEKLAPSILCGRASKPYSPRRPMVLWREWGGLCRMHCRYSTC